ncbi:MULTISPECIES: hypothetical protein [Mycobacterium]|uniref:Uncharacterized protein n=1 Tax=Mycobacterium paraffinicum TaxID=53378 RepID=A0A1Q4HPD5_9MYCO|nr:MULTISPECIES: hypothetical protein [Mycobacterium]OCB23959.1 hypothetical protein A5689_14710 [Mycobacterium intracellulare subsp. yongonense]OJZ69403.1 hypothetical protein BRW65_22580 [Mycobacterium paraffinicum]
MTVYQETTHMDYGLWLLREPTGAITLTGWSETPGTATDSAAAGKTEHWPTYTVCREPSQLSARLAELGLDLAAGHDLSDLDKDWDVYVRHPDIAALRAALDTERARDRR